VQVSTDESSLLSNSHNPFFRSSGDSDQSTSGGGSIFIKQVNLQPLKQHRRSSRGEHSLSDWQDGASQKIERYVGMSDGGGGQVSIALGSKCAEFSTAKVAK